MKINHAHIRITAVVAAVVLLVYFLMPRHEVHLFKDLHGPTERSVLPEAKDAIWSDYSSGSSSRLAILLTDEDSGWLGLAHGLKSAGVPFTITADYKEAVQHKVVMVYPVLSGSVLNRDALQALANVARRGDTLISFNVLGGGLNGLFGFTDAVPSRQHQRLTFTQKPNSADPHEKIMLINRKSESDSVGTYAYTQPQEKPLAVYDDGSAAIITHKVGSGRAIAFGVDVGDFLHIGYNGYQDTIARSYNNTYEPAADNFLWLIADIYRERNDAAVLIKPVPQGKDLAVIMTHDIDYTKSIVNSAAYAKLEHEVGIRGTYFIQTKYIKDYNDDIILGSQSAEILQGLSALGMELASHSVAHSRQMRSFPMGDGEESYPEYHPFVHDKSVTTDGTILGELRVSHFLLESLAQGVRIHSFRPGHLSNPTGLPQALIASGYKYSSSVSANDSLTHLPFQLTYDRKRKGEVPVFEFPVTIEDEEGSLIERLPDSISLAKKIAKRGGLCVVLIHPNVIESKLIFEKKFIDAVRAFSWFGAIEDIGAWWAARNAVGIDAEWKGQQFFVKISAPVAVEGLTLQLPDAVQPVKGQAIISRVQDSSVVLKKIEGVTEIVFTRRR